MKAKIDNFNMTLSELKGGYRNKPYWATISNEKYEPAMVVFAPDAIKVYGLFDYNADFAEEKQPPFLVLKYGVLFSDKANVKYVLDKIKSFVF